MKTTKAGEKLLHDFKSASVCFGIAPENVYISNYYQKRPGSKYFRLNVLDRIDPPKPDMFLLTHEIGHFVTVPISRLGFDNYGFRDVQKGLWTVSAFESEMSAYARQMTLLKKLRCRTAAETMVDQAQIIVKYFCTKYVASQPSLKKDLSQGLEVDHVEIVKLHIRKRIDEIIEKKRLSYDSIREEYQRRASLLEKADALTSVSAK